MGWEFGYLKGFRVVFPDVWNFKIVSENDGVRLKFLIKMCIYRYQWMDMGNIVMEEQSSDSVTFPLIYLERTKTLDIFIDFMLKNQPCRMYNKATDKWKSRQQWVKYVNGKSTINIEFLIKHYGYFFIFSEK